MVNSPGVSAADPRNERIPPNSEEAEKGVLGSILMDAARVTDICIEKQISPGSFYVPAHGVIFESVLELSREGKAIDVVTLEADLSVRGNLDAAGGSVYLDQLVDATPTAAHAEFYIDIVRQKHLLRSIIACSRESERECFACTDDADMILGRVEQAFMDITQNQHGFVTPWPEAVKGVIAQVELILTTKKGLTGISTGFANMDEILHGLRNSEMIVLAARPSMGKTSLAMNIAENVALGKLDPDSEGHAVGIFSLEMSHEALVLRMLCSHAKVSSFQLTKGHLPTATTHGKIMQAAAVLTKAPVFLDDTGGLDIMELRARARRMKKKHDIKLIVIDYLQLIHSQEYARQGKQVETAYVSGNIKAMAKELKVPVLVLSQLSRAPEQRGTSGAPKLSDLRDSGAIEQDADVVCMLRRPAYYPDDPDHDDETMAVVTVAKHRNGPTGDIVMNFEQEFMRFTDRNQGYANHVPPEAEGFAEEEDV
jgi:replicative DNA helicase